MTHEDLIALAPEERLALIAALWESLDEAVPSPAAQAAELARRLRAFEQDRPAALTWDALKAELANRQS